MKEILVREGQLYKFDAPNATGWWILKEIRQGKHGIELLCQKNALGNVRIFERQQITNWDPPKGIVGENYVKVCTLYGHDLFTTDIVYWRYTDKRGRKPTNLRAA